MQQTQTPCLFDGDLPSEEGTPPHAAAGPLAKDFAKLGDGWGCAKGRWVGKCALWLWLWPWQPKPCPVRTTARSKSSKSFPFPLTEETHTEGHTSKNLASLPREARPEDKIPQRKRKIHMSFYLCIEKMSFEKV